MLLIDNRSETDPAQNLALEEFLMGCLHGGETALLFYVNDPVVVIGRNQIPYVEARLQQLAQERIPVIRRISGGGAVYHGPGNLNFSLIQGRREAPFLSPAEVVQPVLDSLQALDLPARLNERHDIVLDGMKITGTAQYRTRKNCLTHGTLLVSADLDRLQQVLAADSDVPFHRGRQSITSPVTNLAHRRPDLTIPVLRDALARGFAARHGPAAPMMLSAGDWAAIAHLSRHKYRSWDWTMGRSPEFRIRRRATLCGGACEALIGVKRGRIVHIDLAVPDTAPLQLRHLGAHLEGCRYHPNDVREGVCKIGFPVEMQDGLGRIVEWLVPAINGWN
jgi:lipoate-protein ligase A